MGVESVGVKDVIFHVIPTLGSGGAEAVLSEYIANDTSTKHCVVTLFNAPSSDFFNVDTAHDHVALQFNANPLRALYSIVNLLRANEGSIAFLWTYHACVLAPLFSFFNWKVIYCIHHSLSDYQGEKWSIKLSIWFIRAFSSLNAVKKILYVSDVSMRGHEEFGFPKSKTVRVDNGLVLEGYKIRSLGNVDQVLEGSFHVGHAARYHSIKNHRLFLESVKYILDCGVHIKAILAGHGVDQENSILMREIAELDLHHVVELRGEVRDMAAFYAEIDVFALTSKAESAPRVVLEALASGVPVVSTDVGDVRVMISSFGLVTDSNPKGFGDGIMLLRKDTCSDTSFGENAHTHVVRNYSINSMIAGYSSIIHEVMTTDRQ